MAGQGIGGDIRTVEDPADLAVLYDPVRYRIVRQLSKPRSVKEVAAALGVPAASLYYHFGLLEEHGFVEQAGTRRSGRKPERLYRSTVHSFRVAPALRDTPVARSNGLIVGALYDIAQEYATALAAAADEDDSGLELIMNRHKRISESRLREYVSRAQALIEDYFGEDAPESDDDDHASYGHLWVIAPFRDENGEPSPRGRA